MLPLTPKQIPGLFQQARAAQAKGEMAAAMAIYDRILAVKPDLAEVHFNVAQVAAAQGKVADALKALKVAAGLKPAEPAIWAAWIDVAKGASKSAELKEISKRLPKSGVPKPALAQLQARIGGGVVDPDEQRLKAATKNNKSSAAAHRQYGEFLISKNRASEALTYLKRAVKLGPDVAATRSALGYAYLRTDEHEAARLAFQKARALGLRTAQHATGQGLVALAQKDDAAVGYFEEALELGDASTALHMMRAAAYRAARQDAEAFAAYDAALALEPENPKIMTEKAALLQNVGQVDQARGLLANALSLEPDNGSLFMLYASAGKLAQGDAVMARAKELYDSGAEDRSLSFAVAKVAETEGENPFPYWVKANSLTRAAFPYSFSADQKAAEEVRTAWLRRSEKAWEKVADTGPSPIFVTGMPRSGTTLVEQIIAAHSDVASAGEVGILGRYIRDLSRAPDMEVIRQRYWQLLQARFPGVARITDKSIATYVKLGFIKTILPNAKIVVVRRDPRDNALSIYKNMFADGQHRYSNDLADIARFMRLFEEQVDFWEGAMPGSFTTVRYDDIIAEPEAQSRKLIADVGLEWQDACLSFYQSTARVDTLSNVQVRQPIYASSVGAWEKYKTELAPFIETYGPIRV
jgi:tetratricopeptide (TPR) repeat protein